MDVDWLRDSDGVLLDAVRAVELPETVLLLLFLRRFDVILCWRTRCAVDSLQTSGHSSRENAIHTRKREAARVIDDDSSVCCGYRL